MIWLWLILAIPTVWIIGLVYRAAVWRADYVHVENDGSIREITADEQTYLEGEFHPNDGGRPYIKTRYRELTPSGAFAGYLERRRVPRGLRRHQPNA